MTLIKRTLSKIQPGDVLIRKSTGERCRLLAIYHNTSNSPLNCLVYRFWGFDVYRTAMFKMFDLADDTVQIDGYIPNLSASYTAVNGYVK